VVRTLESGEVDDLLHLAVPIHLATVDAEGFPHITPLWFDWDGQAFWMTSLPHKPHVRRLRRNPAASICLDVEGDERADGERPNRQVRGIGHIELMDDVDGERTQRITEKYLHGPGREAMVSRRVGAPRVALRLVPRYVVAVASV
jgi:nitroimidazol reductase NimA-like FMN-containing flavoprotein (pyridoxamine 5'-phosphate oxidase superfamily)